MIVAHRHSTAYQPHSAETPDGDVALAMHTGAPVLITAARRHQRENCARLIHAARGEQGPFVVFSVDVVTPSSGPRGDAPADDGRGLRRQFRQARGGTLFIEDIARLTRLMQAQLYRLLEEDVAGPCHPSRARSTAVRLISGANRHLGAERRSGAFSERLFYRLNVIHLDLLTQQPLNSASRDRFNGRRLARR